MLYYTILYYIILYYTIIYYTILYYTTLYYTVHRLIAMYLRLQFVLTFVLKIQKRLTEKVEVIELKDQNAVENEEKEIGTRTFRTSNKGNKNDNFATQNSLLSLIYEKNVICPTALFLFKECSVLCMPFAELGQSVYFFIYIIYYFYLFIYYFIYLFIILFIYSFI